MKLLIEGIESAQVIKEAVGGGHNYFLEGIFLQGGIQNRNGRVYPTDVLDKEVRRYTKEFVNKRRAFGEFGHPESPAIQMERISHMITELKRDGDNFHGKAKIIGEGYGKIARSLIDEGALLGMSSRGVGTVSTRNGIHMVEGDFQLTTAADIVAEPSAPDAFVEGVMENAEWIQESDGKWRRKFIRQVKQQVFEARRANPADLERVLSRAFEHLLVNVARR